MDFFKAQFTKIPRVAQVNLSASTVLVTGANTGLGLEAAREIVKSKPRRLILAVRNVDKGNAAKKALETAKGGDTSIEVRKLDQASFASVQAFAKDLEGEPIDIAILNAGMELRRAISALQAYIFRRVEHRMDSHIRWLRI